jgi:hypothetical protein
MFIHELGLKAKDKITGIEGIIVGRCEHLFGCNTYGIAPQKTKEGKRLDTEWFDEGRIEIIGKGIEPSKVKVEKPGCDYREHP